MVAGIALITRSTASLGKLHHRSRWYAKGNEDLETFVKSFAKIQMSLQAIRSGNKFVADMQSGLSKVAQSGGQLAG